MGSELLTVFCRRRDDVVDRVHEPVGDVPHKARDLREVECLLGTRGPVARHGLRPVVCVDCYRQVEPEVAYPT